MYQAFLELGGREQDYQGATTGVENREQEEEESSSSESESETSSESELSTNSHLVVDNCLDFGIKEEETKELLSEEEDRLVIKV